MSFKRNVDCKQDQKLISYHDALSRISEVANSQAASWQFNARQCSYRSTGGELELTKASLVRTDASFVSLGDALGKKNIRKLIAPHSTPQDDTSAMDGFAVCSTETLAASDNKPLMLRVVDTIAAGDEYRSKIGTNISSFQHQNVCAEIMTGACFPETSLPHLDAVVKIEDVAMVDWSEDGATVSRYIQLKSPVKPFQHRRPAGSDFHKDDLIVDEGHIIRPKHIAALASLGFDRIEVEDDDTGTPEPCPTSTRTPKLRIGVLPTGSELEELGTKHRNDQMKQIIPDSNGPYLTSTIRSHYPWADVKYLGVAVDDEESLTRQLAEATSGDFDIVVSSGGVSMGRFDLVRHVVETRLKGEIIFHGVAIRPGAPVLFARFGKEAAGDRQVAFFGAPGNPLAAAVALQFFVFPYISNLTAASIELPLRRGHESGYCFQDESEYCAQDCTTKTPVRRKPKDMTVFWLAAQQSENAVEIIDDQASYKLSGLLKADCWVVLPAGQNEVHTGDRLKTWPL